MQGKGGTITHDDVARVEGVLAVECDLEVGQTISRREGTGQHTGRVLVVTGSRDRTARSLTEAVGLLRVSTRAVA